MRLTFLIAISLLCCIPAHLRSFPDPDLLLPVRTETPPVLDGRLNDVLWQGAPYVTGFRTFIPDFGHVMPESTVTSA